MKRKYVQVMVVLAAFSLFGMLTIQLFGLTLPLKDKKVNLKVNIAQREVTYGLVLASKD